MVGTMRLWWGPWISIGHWDLFGPLHLLSDPCGVTWPYPSSKGLLFVVLLESYALKLGILVHKRKFTGKEHDEHNILHVYCMLDCWYDISNFTGNKHSKVIYIAWWYIIKKEYP